MAGPNETAYRQRRPNLDRSAKNADGKSDERLCLKNNPGRTQQNDRSFGLPSTHDSTVEVLTSAGIERASSRQNVRLVHEVITPWDHRAMAGRWQRVRRDKTLPRVMIVAYLSWGFVVTSRNDSRHVWIRILVGPGLGLVAAVICGALLVAWRGLRHRQQKSPLP